MSRSKIQSNRLSEGFKVEQFLFARRKLVLTVFVLLSLFLLTQAVQVKPDASLERMIPQHHPYVQNALEHREDLENLSNFIRIAVVAREGDIFSESYMSTLEAISDEAFYLPGVDRTGLKSLWTPNVRWVQVTENGFEGGPVIPSGYDGSAENLEILKQNILRSGQVGRLVSNDFKSSVIYVPLLEVNPETGERLDYQAFSATLEEKIRDKYTSENTNIEIKIVGFAKKVGDLIDGFTAVVFFFGIAVLITSVLLYAYTRDVRSSGLGILCSLIAVVWQLGLMHLLGYGLDPYSVLVPFIVFATAVSHSVQFINGFQRGLVVADTALDASRATFRHHYIPAILALVSDVIGFFSLSLIEIDVIRDLALVASIGIASIIVTNLILLPILTSFFHKHDGRTAAPMEGSKLYTLLEQVMTKHGATKVFACTLVLTIVSLVFAANLKVGELDPGAPELHHDSRYNLDNAYLAHNYATSPDVMVLMVKTAPEGCTAYQTLRVMESLQWRLEHLNAVQSTFSMANLSTSVTKAFNEGNLKWSEVSRNQRIIDTSLQQSPAGFINGNCSLTPIFVFLNDHKADSLLAVTNGVRQFTDNFPMDGVEVLLAAGNGGIEAATNEVIASSQYIMLLVVFVVVGAMVLFAYKSVKALVCILAPLVLTSLVCMALMAILGIGVKVSTLPIIALGVGLGVDYSIYVYSRLSEYLSEGFNILEAYRKTLYTTGKAVAFTGFTLSIGTATWIFSPIKFQSDMGILLTFMFIWNMVGAMTLLPALRYMFYVRTEREPWETSVA